MRINEDIVAQARTADVLAFLIKYHGFTFAHRGGSYRCKRHPSLAVKDDCLSFYWHSKGVGGVGVIDYLVKVENMTFREAVEVITGISPTSAPPPIQHEPPKPKPLVLPEKSGLALRLYDYLCNKRGIDTEIVNMLIQRKMLYEDKRGNVVFVGYDEHDKARLASLRGTHGDCNFRGDCSGSDKRYGFNIAASAPSERLYIYESPIDLMSHASLENAATGDTWVWLQHNRLSLSGTTDTAIPFFLNQYKAIKELVLCLDNDTAGRDAALRLSAKYVQKGYLTRIELPSGKDYNEDLQVFRRQFTRKHSIEL